MRIFVTGGTGFIGQRLVPALLGRGHQVVALVRTYERARELPRGVRAVAGDVTKPESYRAQLAGCDAVLHAASASGVAPARRERERLERINVGGSRSLREAALAAGVGRYVHLSAPGVYGVDRAEPVREGEPPDPARALTFAAATRAQAHLAAMEAQGAGEAVIIVVPGAPYDPTAPQPADPEHVLWRGERLWVLSGRSSRRAWVAVDRLAAGLCDVIERGTVGAIYHLPGAVRPLHALNGAHGPTRIWLPLPLARVLARLWRDVWPGRAERWRALAGGDQALDCARARADLGWDPATTGKV